jgi:hypothetical protein
MHGTKGLVVAGHPMNLYTTDTWFVFTAKVSARRHACFIEIFIHT